MNVILENKIKIGLCILWFFISMLDIVTMQKIYQLPIAIMLPVMLGLFVLCIVTIFKNIRKDKVFAFIPLLIFFTCLVTPSYLGPKIRKNIFLYRLPKYIEVVNRASSKIELDNKLINIDLNESEKNLALAVSAGKYNGVLYVDFLVGGGFPARHFGYVYTQSGTIESIPKLSNRWPYLIPMAPGWFQFND